MIVAASLWISRSSWSANNFAFTAAADRPHMAAYFTSSGASEVDCGTWPSRVPSDSELKYQGTTSTIMKSKPEEYQQYTFVRTQVSMWPTDANFGMPALRSDPSNM